MRQAAFLALLSCACGTGGASSGPSENPPGSGATGYHKLEGTYVLLDPVADLTDPAVLADSPDGPFHLWFTWNGTEIRRSDLPHLGTDATPPRPALAPDPGEGFVRAPSVAPRAGGWVMYYESRGGLIGMATSSDGETWQKGGGGGTLPDAHAPSFANQSLFYESGGMIYDVLGHTIVTGTDPDLIVHTTPAGRPLWQLFYGCPGRDSRAICYAASWDGVRFATTGTPILQPDPPDETGPAAVIGDFGGVLFFSQTPTGLKARIGAAVTP